MDLHGRDALSDEGGNLLGVGLLEVVADRALVIEPDLNGDRARLRVGGGLDRRPAGGERRGGDRLEAGADRDAVALHVERAGAGRADRGDDDDGDDGDDGERDDDEAALQGDAAAAILLLLLLPQQPCLVPCGSTPLVLAETFVSGTTVCHQTSLSNPINSDPSLATAPERNLPTAASDGVSSGPVATDVHTGWCSPLIHSRRIVRHVPAGEGDVIEHGISHF